MYFCVLGMSEGRKGLVNVTGYIITDTIFQPLSRESLPPHIQLGGLTCSDSWVLYFPLAHLEPLPTWLHTLQHIETTVSLHMLPTYHLHLYFCINSGMAIST